MKETWLLWKTIFTKPEEGFRQITGETRVIIPLVALIVLLLAIGFVLVPVVTSDAYRAASLRAYQDFIRRSDMFPDEASRRTAAEQVASPLGRSVDLMRVIAGPVANFLAAAIGSAAFIWLVGFAFRSRIRYGTALRVFVFSWAVMAWQALLTAVVLLLSDYRAALGHVGTLTALRYALSVPFSLSIFFPPGSVPPAVLLAIDFVTNIFNIIFYCLLAVGIRAQSERPAAWKAAIAAGGIALCHFLYIAVPAFFL